MKKTIKISIIIFSVFLLTIFITKSGESSSSINNSGLLKWHNYFRSLHGVPGLRWSRQLQNLAQNWANYLARTKSWKHRPRNRYGENIYWIRGASPRSKNVVKSWYDEINYYNYNRPGFSMKTGHFTQVVWKNSRYLGCGWAQARDGGYYVVCNYNPPGNYRGRFSSNVPRRR